MKMKYNSICWLQKAVKLKPHLNLGIQSTYVKYLENEEAINFRSKVELIQVLDFKTWDWRSS